MRTQITIGLISIGYIFFLFPSADLGTYNKDSASLFLTMSINLAEFGIYSADPFSADQLGKHGTWPPILPLLLALSVKCFGVNWVILMK